MVGSERFVSNAVSTPTITYVTVANNTRLRTSAQGIVVLKAYGSRTHITLNDVLIIQNLRFNLFLAAQLMDCGVELSTDIHTRDILLHYTTPKKVRRQIELAHSENGVYVFDFDILDCGGDTDELIDLVPLRFEEIHHSEWKHPDGRPWVPHHPQPRKVALHYPGPDGVCRDCHMPTALTSAIAGWRLAAIAEAERLAPPEEGMSTMELEIATHSTFETEEHPLPEPASQHLQRIVRGTSHGTFDANGKARPYTKEDFLKIYSHWRDHDPKKKLTIAQEEELARRKAEELCQKSLAEARGTFACSTWGAEEEESASNEGGWGRSNVGRGTSNTGGWGNIGGTGADSGSGWGATSGGGTSGWGTSGGGWGASREEQRGGGTEAETEPPIVPLGRPPRLPAPALPPPDVQPHRHPWDTIDWGNEPSTPRRTVYGPDPKPREPTFVPGTIPKTNIPLSVILDREF
ncbi:unnamed protein product [Closterium sp. NIES-53]